MTAQTVLPRWRGFNLPYLAGREAAFSEDEFRWIADWGFNFVRIPMNYRRWTDSDDVYAIKESTLERVDWIVQTGEKYGIHISLNFHNAPGYCINPTPQPFNLWQDPEGEQAFSYHWAMFARRYKGISSDKLSFDLVNEPPPFSWGIMTLEDHERVIRAAVGAIRAEDPDRLIIADGLNIGNDPIPGIEDLHIAQSCRGYVPHSISHFLAHWAGGLWHPRPTWPERHDTGLETPYDREKLHAHFTQWAALAKSGVGVHCGEAGAARYTPHDVYLAWFRDVLDILTEFGIGYAMWNLVGPFGVLDSGRKDVNYASWRGHKLDKQLLDLLLEF